MAQPRDAHLWNIVKARCTPMGQPVPGDRVLGMFYLSVEASTLDLHHLTVAEAHARSDTFLDCAAQAGRTEVEIVTGRSGQIRREFEAWAELHPRVRGVQPLNGGGAFRLKLR